jgi:hypothetical protein
MVTVEVLAGLGLLDDPLAPIEVVLSSEGGETRASLEPVVLQRYEQWAGGHHSLSPPGRPDGALWLRNLSESIWWELLAETKTAFIQYNMVTPTGDVVPEVAQAMDNGEVDRIVVDMRHNSGGDNTVYGRLLEFLQSPSANRAGFLYVIMGRATFSAGGNFVTEVERTTEALLVGEDLGTSPNQYGDSSPLLLPHSGLIFRVAPQYVVRSQPDDPRITIEPHITALLRADEYFADHDPALTAILAQP